MRFSQIREKLATFRDEKPNEKPSLATSLELLAATVVNDVPMYISGPAGFYVYGMLVPMDMLKAHGIEELVNWNFTVPSGWSYGYMLGQSPEQTQFMIAPPLDSSGSEVIDSGEPIFFLRDFPGVKSYVELNQKLGHLLDIHSRNLGSQLLFQRLDQNGDFVDVVIIEREPSIICTIKQKELEQLALLLESVPVRVFDILTAPGEYPIDSDRQAHIKLITDFGDDIVYWGDSLSGIEGGYVRGVQVLKPKHRRIELARSLRGEHERQYATFTALDWKNGLVQECSCDPNQLGNYFVESNLPYETSPAFFRPEVLLKYQQDPEKFGIEGRRLHCRGTWELRYDINETGQLHVYLIDLSRIPFNEQLYWKSFNEEPTSGISARAMAQDFEGRWVSFETELDLLKKCLKEFPIIELDGDELTVYTIHEDSFGRLDYVRVGSRKEWEDQVMNLTKLLVDGLQKSTINRLSRVLGCHDSKLGSIKLLGNCFLALGVDPPVVDQVVGFLGELWSIRSQIAHPGAIEHDDYTLHFRRLVERGSEAIQILADVVGDVAINDSSE